MTVHELNKSQIHELKERWLVERSTESGEGVSYGELAEADEIVSDETIFKAYGDTEFTAEDFSDGETEAEEPPFPREAVVTAYMAEMSKGKFLHINDTEDGDGTWFDTTESVWDAYWDKSLDCLKESVDTEFHGFEPGYPKYHKVRFGYEVLETEEA